MAVAINTTLRNTYPPKVLVSVTGLTPGDSIAVYRIVAGQRAIVRAATDDAVSGTAFLRTDAELPFSVPVRYLALVNGTDEYETSPTTYALPGGKVAISDAITGLSAEVAILSWPEKTRSPESSRFNVGGRNIVVQGSHGMFESTLELFVETTSASAQLEGLLDNATSGIIQIRQPGGYDRVDCYVSVVGSTERRFSQDGSDQRRIWALEVVEVEGWAPNLRARGFTYKDWKGAYAGLTYADAAGDYSTYLEARQADPT